MSKEPHPLRVMRSATASSAPPRGRSDTPHCPQCRSREVIPIVYGYPPRKEEVIQGVENGVLLFGGYYVGYDSPEWHCKACMHEFGRVSYDG